MDFERHYRRGGIPRVILRGAGDEIASAGSTIQSVLAIIDRERDYWSDYPLPLSHRLTAYRHGFLSKPYKVLELHKPENDPENYLSSIMQGRVIWSSVNSSYNCVLKNKAAFHIATEPYIDGLPELYGFIRDGEFDGWQLTNAITDIPVSEVFIKPITGGFGEDAQIIETASLDPHHYDQDYIVTEVAQQHDYAEKIWPGAANTIRTVTTKDPATGEFFVASAVHRFGVAGIGPRDNMHAGGVAAPIDVDTGELGVLRRASESDLEYLDKHPDTDVVVEGQTIPHWMDILEFATELAELHRERPWAGWDIVLTPDGPMVLEGNKNPDMVLQQIGGGLLEDERVRRFIDQF